MFGLNKFTIYGIVAAVSISIFATFVIMWRNSIRQQALLEANNRQLTQLVKDQEEFIKKMDEVYQIQRESIESINKKNEELRTQLSGLEVYLSSDSVQGNRASSEVLRETIKQLRGKR
jgi:uncharacterized protein YoxC